VGFVQYFSVVGVKIGADISFSPQDCACENIRTRGQLRLLLRLGLDWLSFGETSLETESFGGHLFALSVLALHLEFVGLCKKVINNFIELVVGHHSPLPLVTIISEVLPAGSLGPLLEQRLHVLLGHVGDLSNDALVLFQSFDNLDKLGLLDAFLLLVELLEQRLDLVFLPLNEGDLRILAKCLLVLLFHRGGGHVAPIGFLREKGSRLLLHLLDYVVLPHVDF